MSYTFSRRDYMKYTALTAVAIAGSGMLTGCSNPNRPVGTIGSTLKPGDGICEATLLNSAGKEPSYNSATQTLTCNFKIVTKIELLEITDSHFQVDVTTDAGTKHYYYNTTPKPSLGDTANPKALKDSVTEKFQPLIVGRAKTAMRQRVSQQCRIGESISQSVGDELLRHAYLAEDPW